MTSPREAVAESGRNRKISQQASPTSSESSCNGQNQAASKPQQLQLETIPSTSSWLAQFHLSEILLARQILANTEKTRGLNIFPLIARASELLLPEPFARQSP
jgi:hypothetical protein